jgi:quinol monooxygenase YgiN
VRRGDTAFCSLECREQHITHEEWKDKCALAISKPTPAMADTVAPVSASSDKPSAEGTLAAA